VCPTLIVYLVSDDDTVLTLFVFNSCLASGIPKLAGAPSHREHYVLGFDTTYALRLDLSAFSLLNKRSGNVAQLPSAPI
jgi:hypothetical protein